jgi:hypothetical protein
MYETSTQLAELEWRPKALLKRVLLAAHVAPLADYSAATTAPAPDELFFSGQMMHSKLPILIILKGTRHMCLPLRERERVCVCVYGIGTHACVCPYARESEWVSTHTCVAQHVVYVAHMRSRNPHPHPALSTTSRPSSRRAICWSDQGGRALRGHGAVPDHPACRAPLSLCQVDASKPACPSFHSAPSRSPSHAHTHTHARRLGVPRLGVLSL